MTEETKIDHDESKCFSCAIRKVIEARYPSPEFEGLEQDEAHKMAMDLGQALGNLVAGFTTDMKAVFQGAVVIGQIQAREKIKALQAEEAGGDSKDSNIIKLKH